VSQVRARPALVVTCEHGGNRVPRRYRNLFASEAELLASHRGWDPGALELARAAARRFRAPLCASNVTRLLVDLNRSLGHPKHFSELTRKLRADARLRIVAEHYAPYRARAESLVARNLARGGSVIHISVHTFTPVLRGEMRRADVAFLYDPRRPAEKAFCAAWREVLRELAPRLRVRFNYPYRGASDGLTTHLRRRFTTTRYLGIELEVNQAAVGADGRIAKAWRQALIESLGRALAAWRPPPRTQESGRSSRRTAASARGAQATATAQGMVRTSGRHSSTPASPASMVDISRKNPRRPVGGSAPRTRSRPPGRSRVQDGDRTRTPRSPRSRAAPLAARRRA
jgi:predicted N-formylglutamate amidohydrolase